MPKEFQFLIVLAILSVVVRFVTAPLRRSMQPDAPGSSASVRALAAREVEREELEAEREAKYREIRDAELDHQTGKLSQDDYELLDRTLRAEAVQILRRLDRLGPE